MEIKCGQWTIRVDESTGKYEILNLGLNDERRFCRVIDGRFGQPLVEPEPDLAIPVPAGLKYVNVSGEAVNTPPERISGIICHDGPRLSLTNALMNNIQVEALDDGSFLIGGEVWYLIALFSKDKNRFMNYDAYFVRTKPDTVLVFELGDLLQLLGKFLGLF
jgi:hypothetical protein